MPEASISFDTFNSFVADPMELTKVKEVLDSLKLPTFKAVYDGKPVFTLSVEKIVSSFDVRNIDAATLDKLVKDELAYQLACKLLDEDLIKLVSNEDIETGNYTIRATIKAIQE